MARMKDSAVGLVSALDKERQLEEEALRGMTPEQKEEFKRLLRQGLWEQDKRLRSDYNRQKLIMLAEVQELTRSLQEAEVMGASPEEIAKYQADVSSLSRLLKDESPGLCGGAGLPGQEARPREGWAGPGREGPEPPHGGPEEQRRQDKARAGGHEEGQGDPGGGGRSV